MFKKAIFIFNIFAFIGFYSFSQNQVDALRYSLQYNTSTAKAAAMGNSLSAVGADLSVSSTNPAGLGVFKSSHMTFTPSFVMNNSQGNYAGNIKNENKLGLTVSNFGFVGVKKMENRALKQFSLSINYNRLNEYRQDVVASGINPNGSILDYYVYNANSPYDNIYNDRWSTFRENLAWDSYLFDNDTLNNEYYSVVTDDGKYGETQRKAVSRKGGAGVYDFSFGANFNDILYFGGTIGLTSVHFSQTVDYQESGFADIFAESVASPGTFIQVNPTELNYRENLVTDGSGANFKFGIILQPIKFLRLGAAIHSSTFYSFTDEYRTTMSSTFAEPDANGDYDYFVDTDINLFTWKLQTPFRANAGIAFILDQKQIGKFYTIPMTFSFDYDYADYSRSHLKSYNFDYTFDNENSQIDSDYGESHSLKAGVELNFGVFKLRGGYQIYTSPYKKDDILDNATSAYSGGIGFGKANSFIDIAYTYMLSGETMYMYDATNSFPLDPMGTLIEPSATINSSTQFIQVTLGLKF